MSGDLAGSRQEKRHVIRASSPARAPRAVLREPEREISGRPWSLDAVSILALQRAAGNAAVTARLGMLANTVPAPRVDPQLPEGLSARTIDGEIYLNPRVPFLPAPEVGRVLRHEAVHSVHQRLWAPVNGSDESEEARNRAERAASRGEHQESLRLAQLLQPCPSVLEYSGKNYGPWPKVWVGHPGVIAEIQEGDVPVRLYSSYAQLQITKGPEYQTFECGNHNGAPIPDLASRMSAVGKQVAEVNAKIPKDAPERVSMVLVAPSEQAGYRTLNGIGLIVLPDPNPDSAAHEAAHALFDFHSGISSTQRRAPSRLALRVAELFTTLSTTGLTPKPTQKFDTKAGKPGATDPTEKQPAGLVMVMDMLWAGDGGHPWDGPDEFFASALGAYLRQPALLQKIIDHYQKVDRAIKKQRAQLMTLLGVATDNKKLGKLAAPTDEKAAKKVIAAQKPAPELTVTRATKTAQQAGRVLSWLIDPDTMPAPTAAPSCTKQPSSSKSKGTFDDFIEK